MSHLVEGEHQSAVQGSLMRCLNDISLIYHAAQARADSTMPPAPADSGCGSGGCTERKKRKVPYIYTLRFFLLNQPEHTPVHAPTETTCQSLAALTRAPFTNRLNAFVPMPRKRIQSPTNSSCFACSSPKKLPKMVSDRFFGVSFFARKVQLFNKLTITNCKTIKWHIYFVKNREISVTFGR